MICKNCGKEISNKSKFCGYCGAKVIEQIEQSQPEAVKESMFSRFHFYKSDLITLWKAVSYTHLDVYKRQVHYRSLAIQMFTIFLVLI